MKIEITCPNCEEPQEFEVEPNQTIADILEDNNWDNIGDEYFCSEWCMTDHQANNSESASAQRHFINKRSSMEY